MGEQQELTWGTEPRARRADPLTSKAAANDARTMAASHRDLIVEILVEHGPSTPEEIAAHSDGGMDKVAVGKRMKELERTLRAEVAADIEERKNESGSKARVWRACA